MTVHPVPALLNDRVEWTSVSSKRPCPVCGSSSSCLVQAGSFACCSKHQSEWPLTTGAWLHRIESNGALEHPLAVAALSGSLAP
jgi:hypothetical protein